MKTSIAEANLERKELRQQRGETVARSSRSHGGFAGWYHWYPHSSQWTLQGWPAKCLAPQRGRRLPPRCLLADIPRKTNENSCLTFFFGHVDQLWYCMILYGTINRICDTEGRNSTKCFMAGLTFGNLWPGGHPCSIQFFHAAASSNQRFGDPASSNCFQNISTSKDVHSPTDMWHERLMRVDLGISPVLDWFICPV